MLCHSLETAAPDLLTSALAAATGPTVADHEAFWAEWALRIQTLEQGIEQARQQGISLSRAKRVLKELQAQANAAEAASRLETVLQRRPCKASVLRVNMFTIIMCVLVCVLMIRPLCQAKFNMAVLVNELLRPGLDAVWGIGSWVCA